MQMIDATLCFPLRDRTTEILLGRKAEKIGMGCWNGYGGKIEPGETQRLAAVREFKEETAGVIVFPQHLEKVAILNCHNTNADGSAFLCKVHVYFSRYWVGKPQETEEMRNPTWFSIWRLPLSEMMPADRIWLPRILEGQKIIATIAYGPNQRNLLEDVIIEEVDTLPEN